MATRAEITSGLAEILEEVAGVNPDDVAEQKSFTDDLDVDSLSMVEVVVARDIVESGNTSAASVPLALSKLVERREVPSGAPVLLFGFGGGLTYAGQVVRCP